MLKEGVEARRRVGNSAARTGRTGERNTRARVAAITGGVEILGAVAVCALLRMGGGDDDF